VAFIEGKVGRTRVALLTVTVEEFEVVSRLFGLRLNINGTPYFTVKPTGARWEVVLRRCPSQTNVISERTTGELIEDLRPEFIILIGTAGGCQGRDHLELGDVVVGDFVDYSGYWKFDAGRVLARKNPHDHPSLFLHPSFVERLRVQSEEWQGRISEPRPAPGHSTLRIGNLVSGDILLGDASNPEQQRIVTHFDKALAFEMEAFGVARAVFSSRRSVHYNPQFLIIRGVSDFVNVDAATNQADRRLWTKYAVSAAAAVAYALTNNLLGATREPMWRQRLGQLIDRVGLG
jgi:nucleoside phosphorylase